MDAAQFLVAVQKMNGLPPGMIEHLAVLAPKMTDEERADTVTKLQPLNTQIREVEGEVLQTVDDEIAVIDELTNTVLPKVQQDIEAGEHAAAEDIFDTNK